MRPEAFLKSKCMTCESYPVTPGPLIPMQNGLISKQKGLHLVFLKLISYNHNIMVYEEPAVICSIESTPRVHNV